MPFLINSCQFPAKPFPVHFQHLSTPLLLLLLWAVGFTFPCKSALSAESRRVPNVVLLLVDDMGWMDSSAYGSKYYETPHMERLAAQSMRFTEAYAVPLCSPTRASILTGQYSARHGITSASGHQPPAAEGASPYNVKPSGRPAGQQKVGNITNGFHESSLKEWKLQVGRLRVGVGETVFAALRSINPNHAEHAGTSDSRGQSADLPRNHR